MYETRPSRERPDEHAEFCSVLCPSQGVSCRKHIKIVGYKKCLILRRTSLGSSSIHTTWPHCHAGPCGRVRALFRGRFLHPASFPSRLSQELRARTAWFASQFL